MVDLTAIVGALNSLKVAFDLTKGAIGLRDERLLNERLEEVRARIREAQGHAIEAQATISTLLDEARELKRKLAQCEERTREKESYELVELKGGGLVYRIKEAARGSAPVHHACATCFKQNETSIMQPYDFYGARSLRCPSCKLEVSFPREDV